MEKRSFLMIYDNHNNVPNGDPFTGEQRYDNASQKIMVSDLRIKRFIRDKFIEMLPITETVFCKYDVIEVKNLFAQIGKSLDITGSSYSFRKYLLDKGIISTIDEELNGTKKSKSSNTNHIDLYDIMKQFIDVRLFGGLLTDTGSNCSIEGAVQFKNLSYSLNKINTEIFQNTTVFPSSTKNEQGSIGTTSIVPYSIIAVEGWLNEETARINNLTEIDVDSMLSGLWLGIRDKNTRSKSDGDPKLLLEIVYNGYDYKYNPDKKVYKTIRNLDTLVKIESTIDDKNIRDFSDFNLNLNDLIEKCSGDNVKVVNFFTEDDNIKSKLEAYSKFNFKDILI